MNKIKVSFKYYDVYLDNSRGIYVIHNKYTNVIEGEGNKLPTVLSQAEALDSVLSQYIERGEDNDEANH